MIKGISSRIKQLVNHIEADTGKLDAEVIMGWIEDVADQLNKIDLQHVLVHLMRHGSDKQELLEIYSFIDKRINDLG